MSPNRRNKNDVDKEIQEDLCADDEPIVLGRKKPQGIKISGEDEGFWSTREFNTGHFYISEDCGSIDIFPIRDGVVSKSSFHFDGYVQYPVYCETCNHVKLFDIDHDAHFCPLCNVWIDKKCSDPNCDFCSTRPEKPLPTFGVDDDSYPKRSRGGWNRYYWVKVDV